MEMHCISFLSKAEGVTRRFNRAKSCLNITTWMGLLNKLNEVHDDPKSTLADEEAVKAKIFYE